MNNCSEFLNFFDELTKDISQDDIPLGVKEFYNFLKKQEQEVNKKPILTELGLQILEYMQQNNKNLKSKDIAEGILVSSRKISGAMRKLVTDGFVDKFGKDPVIYNLTEKGQKFNIEIYKGDKINEI